MQRFAPIVALLSLSLIAGSATAQSRSLLEEVRLHKPSARKSAQAERQACGDCPQKDALRFLEGYLALAEGDASAARALLEKVAPLPGLEAHQAYYLGQARFYAQDPAAAAKSFEEAAKSGVPALAQRSRSRLAEALLATGRVTEALALLETAAREADLPELYLQRGVAREALGNAVGAQADFRTVAVRFPAHPAAASAEARLPVQKGAKTPFTFDEHLSRARRFLDAPDPQGAIVEADRALASPAVKGKVARAKLSLVKAQALAALGRDADAQSAIDDAKKGAPATAAEAQLLRARRAMRQSNAAGKPHLEELLKKYPDGAPAEEAAYLLGWIALQQKAYDESIKRFEEFDAKHGGSRKADEALWFKAFAELQKKAYPEARASLERLAKGHPKSSLVPQARYWFIRAKELEAKGPTPALAAEYQAVIDGWPGSFYSLLSAARIRALGKEPRPGFPAKPVVREQTLPSELTLLSRLSAVGLFRDAADEVGRLIAGVRNADGALRLGHGFLALGEYGAAHQLAARHLWGAAYTDKKPEAVALFYPRAFREEVETNAKAEGVDPFLVWAIMRRESAFKPDVMSMADARGLMQVIPPTATQIAAEVKLPIPAPEDLFSPSLSIRFGAWYLAKLMERFKHPTLAAGAYNAGPSPVLRWAKERRELPLDEFVEQIPFKETRGYVKQVVGDLHLYHALYGEPEKAPTLALELPTPGETGVAF